MLSGTIHRESVKAALRIAFGSIANFEAERGLASGAVTDLLRGRKARRTAEAVAAALDITADHLVFGLQESSKADCSRENGSLHLRKVPC